MWGQMQTIRINTFNLEFLSMVNWICYEPR